MLRRVNFLAGEVDRIDLEQKKVIVSHGFDQHPHTLEFDFLVLAAADLHKTAVHKILNSPTDGDTADPEPRDERSSVGSWSPTRRSPAAISPARTVSTRA